MKKSKIILVCLTAASLLLNAVLIHLIYRQFAQSRIKRVLAYYRPTPKTNPDTKYILFLGDSRIQEWNPLPVCEGKEILNVGCGGATTSDLLVQLVRMDFPAAVEVAVIEIGINDLTVIGLNPAQKDEIILRCKSNITAAVEILMQKNIPVLLLPVLPAGKIGWLRRCIWSDQIDWAIEDVNRHLKSLQNEKLILVDCPELIAPHGRIHQQFSRDSLHLNARGYEILNAIVLRSMNKLTSKRSVNAF